MCWQWPCSPCVCGSRLSTAACVVCRWLGNRAPQGGRAANGHRAPRQRGRSYGNRGRTAAPAPAPAPAPASAVAAASAGAPMPPRGAAAPMPMGTSAAASVPPRNAVPASAAVPSGAVPRGRAPGPPGRQRLDAQQHPDAGAVGGGCLGAGRPGRAATHCGARSQDVTQGSPRGGARLRRPARLPNWRLARPVAPRRPRRPSALSGRPRPARQQLLRTPPQPAVLLRAFPPRPRASRRVQPGLRCAFRRSRPPRALAVFPLRHFPKLKRPAPRMLSALAFS